MARYNLGVRTTDGTTGAACLEIIAPQKWNCRLVELGISLVAATASTFGLGVPGAKGVTPTTPVRVLGFGDPVSTQTMVALAWATGPTIPAAFYRRKTLPATIGAEAIWRFEGDDRSRGLTIPSGGSMVLWNLSAVSLIDAYIVIDEAG